MKVDQFLFKEDEFKYSHENIEDKNSVSFVLVFAPRQEMESQGWLKGISEKYPQADIVSCSSSGEVYLSEVLDNSVTGMAVALQKSSVEIHSMKLEDGDSSKALGERLSAGFTSTDLRHVLVFSDGWLINGVELLEGMYRALGRDVLISGGLAGDGANFSKTLVGLNGEIDEGQVVAIGFYGQQIEIGFGSHGGWDVFGDSHIVTATEGRVIKAMDGKSPLSLYKQFMGDDADGLPGAALLYPLSVVIPESESPLVRTVYSIDEVLGHLIIGQEIPVGTEVRFMKAEFDDLLNGSSQAVQKALSTLNGVPEFCLVISCIGRKLLFDRKIEEEIASTQSVLGSEVPIGGFYSYGEICPAKRGLAELHHQMLAVTLIREN
ncbi:FIST N-terminal domain-containing protein [uncultured Roseivirga sp.]|uniref:FIST signal transduction protein n=1 Tax=uncultured Roseivirga sp. TaxID=543088 RepID=UPI000D7A638B|nr:FIST N-terminal domain-containing protein [uncultured Roseivirga sp.]PWL28335.1 MAG: histidine kinase [Roseivirga sp. XM-24bin3]